VTRGLILLILFLVITSCGQVNIPSQVPGDAHYTLSAGQVLVDGKGTGYIDVTVTVDPAYTPPSDTIYIWFAVERNMYSDYFPSSPAFYPAHELSISAGTIVNGALTLQGRFSIFGHQNWDQLNDLDLSDENEWSGMMGFYLVASDGYSYSPDPESTYALHRQDDAYADSSNSFAFADRFPKGPGRSDYLILSNFENQTDKVWLAIEQAPGYEVVKDGATIASDSSTATAIGDTLTVIYRSTGEYDYPYLYLANTYYHEDYYWNDYYYSGSLNPDPYNGTGPVYDPALGVYVWTWEFLFAFDDTDPNYGSINTDSSGLTTLTTPNAISTWSITPQNYNYSNAYFNFVLQ